MTHPGFTHVLSYNPLFLSALYFRINKKRASSGFPVLARFLKALVKQMPQR